MKRTIRLVGIVYRALIITCFLVPATMSTAQETPLSEKQYADQHAKLFKAYTKNPDDVESMLLLAEFYADTLNPMRDYASAMRMITQAEKRLIALVEDRDQTKEVRLLLRKGVTVVRVRQTKRDIIRLSREYMATNPPLSEKELDNYAEAFGDDPYVMRYVEQRRIHYRFQQTKKEHTLASYDNFITTFSATKEGEEALKLMTDLAAQQIANTQNESQVDSILDGYLNYPSIQTVATRRKSALAYNQLTKNPSPEAYRLFLARYPGSDEYSQVLAKLDNLSENEFATLTTPRQLADFAHNNPDNPLADQAIDKIKQMIHNEHNHEALTIYLEEFKLDFDHDNIYLDYFNWHTAEGNRAPIVRFAVLHPDFPYSLALKDALEAASRLDSIDIYTPFNEKDFQQWASKIYHLTGKKISFVALQRTLQPLLAAGDWKKALARIDFFSICFEEHCLEEVAELRSLIAATPDPSLNFSHIVRPAYDFMHPVMTNDGNHILYNRVVGGHTEIHRAEKTKGRRGIVWRGEGPLVFTNFVNNGLQIFNLYDNGKKMLLGYRGNIMTAEYTDGGWTVTETLPAPVNSQHNDFDAFMLPDGSGILFASDRTGGMNLQPTRSRFHGDTALASDLWFAPKTDDGWGKPINLGITVNTPYMECCPILSDDLHTLYFISDAHGLGYGDIYYTTRESTDDWTHWTQPVNCGKSVNTGFNEASISWAPDHRTIVSSSNSEGHYGCYSFTPHKTGGNRSVTVSLAPDDNDMVITLVDLTSQKELASNLTVSGGTQWHSELSSNKSYLLFTQYQDMLTPGILFIPTSRRTLNPVAYDDTTLLEMSQKGTNLTLPAIMFENNSSTLLTASLNEIFNIAHFLKQHPTLTIEIVTHVEGNDDTFCYNLSQERGQEIKKQLTQLGIDHDNIVVSPYGNSITKQGYVKTSTAVMMHKIKK